MTKKVSTKKERGLSDSNLLKLRRKVVYSRFNNKCFFCGKSKELEDHHIVKRKNFLLRYDWRNSILLCKYICHQYAETPEGKHKIDKFIEPYRNYLQARSVSCKQYFVERGITRKDFLKTVYAELQGELMKFNDLPF